MAMGKLSDLNVSGKRVLSDGARSVEIHEIRDSVHAQGFLMVYLPAEKLLLEADAYTPLPPGAKPPSPPNANNVNLVDNIERGYGEIWSQVGARVHHNLLITGPTGIGKSWLASAFVQSACRHGFSATYVRAPRLLH